MKRLICLVMLVLAGCATIIDGHTQQIVINTNPSGASCTLMRNGEPLGTINPTPGALVIEKTKYDITITCKKPGYETATYLNHSGADVDTFGDIVLSGGIGWAIDSASGSDNKYDSPVNLSLNKK
jgi:PEGA domain-containing protein